MSQPPAKPPAPGQNPADFAREAFRLLATRRIAPTPDNYRELYNEVAGIPAAAPVAAVPAVVESPGAERMLSEFANKLSDTPGDLADFGRRFNRAVAARDWDAYARSLSQLVEKPSKKTGGIELLGPLDGAESKQLRDLLSRTLTFAVASLLTGNPALVKEAESLGRRRQDRPLRRSIERDRRQAEATVLSN